MPTTIDFMDYNFYRINFKSNGTIDLLWNTGASNIMNADTLWTSFKASSDFAGNINFANYSGVEKFNWVFGGSGNDTITKSTGGEIFGYGGNDIITAFATGNASQQHVEGGNGNDTLNLNFTKIDTSLATAMSTGHHVRGDVDGSLSQGSDIFNFTGLDSVNAGKTVSGRIEDFDVSRDTLQISGVTINLAALPSNAKIVLHNGEHNDVGAAPSQWLVITTTNNGHIVYALEGVRADMNGDGLSNSNTQEGHFITPATAAAIIAQAGVRYIDPQNVVPAGFTAQGGMTINDYDENAVEANTEISGGTSGDLIAAGLNNDTVKAGAGNDRVWGGSGHDKVNGEAGNDTLAGNLGNDVVNGGDGDDTITHHEGADTIDGGTGIDTLVFSGATAVIISMQNVFNNQSMVVTNIENLSGTTLADELAGDGLANTIIGNDGNDTLTGWGGNDNLQGGNGEDSLGGLSGTDILIGGAGNDSLQGGTGIDTLTGGLGNDQFRFIGLSDNGDAVTDYGNVAGNDDVFVIKVSGFGAGLTAGALTSAKFWSSTSNAAHDADDRFIFRTSDKTLWFDADGNGTVNTSVLVADLQDTAPNVTFTDFLLY